MALVHYQFSTYFPVPPPNLFRVRQSCGQHQSDNRSSLSSITIIRHHASLSFIITIIHQYSPSPPSYHALYYRSLSSPPVSSFFAIIHHHHHYPPPSPSVSSITTTQRRGDISQEVKRKTPHRDTDVFQWPLHKGSNSLFLSKSLPGAVESLPCFCNMADTIQFHETHVQHVWHIPKQRNLGETFTCLATVIGRNDHW